MTAKTIGEWILEEVDRRHLSVRAFARLVKLSHGTLLPLIGPQGDTPTYPSLETLVRLAEGTSTDLCTLVALVYPALTHIDPEVLILAQRISQLPPDKQQIVDGFILSTRLKGGNESE